MAFIGGRRRNLCRLPARQNLLAGFAPLVRPGVTVTGMTHMTQNNHSSRIMAVVAVYKPSFNTTYSCNTPHRITAFSMTLWPCMLLHTGLPEHSLLWFYDVTPPHGRIFISGRWFAIQPGVRHCERFERRPRSVTLHVTVLRIVTKNRPVKQWRNASNTHTCYHYRFLTHLQWQPARHLPKMTRWLGVTNDEGGKTPETLRRRRDMTAEERKTFMKKEGGVRKEDDNWLCSAPFLAF